MTTSSTRRSFIRKAAILAGMPTIIPASVLGQNGNVAPSNRIVVGGIGLGPRGREVLKSFLSQADVQFVAIADVQKARREIIRKTVNRQYGNEDCKGHRDMREVLDTSSEVDMITKAHLAAERLEKANELNKELVRRMEALEARRVLGGQSTAGEPQQRELTQEEKYNQDIKNYFKGSVIEKVL